MFAMFDAMRAGWARSPERAQISATTSSTTATSGNRPCTIAARLGGVGQDQHECRGEHRPGAGEHEGDPGTCGSCERDDDAGHRDHREEQVVEALIERERLGDLGVLGRGADDPSVEGCGVQRTDSSTKM
jgi:hypothetical protein